MSVTTHSCSIKKMKDKICTLTTIFNMSQYKYQKVNIAITWHKCKLFIGL